MIEKKIFTGPITEKILIHIHIHNMCVYRVDDGVNGEFTVLSSNVTESIGNIIYFIERDIKYDSHTFSYWQVPLIGVDEVLKKYA